MGRLILFVLVSALITYGLLGWVNRESPADLPTFSYVTTARQLGVVGYRDPVGALSPDGWRVAYTEGRYIRVVPVAGGAPVTLAPGEGQIRYLAWKGNDAIVAEDVTPAGRWWTYAVSTGERRPLWAPEITNPLRQLVWTTDGSMAAAFIFTADGPEMHRFAADGSRMDRRRLTGRVSSLAFLDGPARDACIVNARVTLPCGGEVQKFEPDQDVIGPIAFGTRGRTIYYASPNDSGMAELWTADLQSRQAHRLSAFTRDAYAPSVAGNGLVMLKTQVYRTFLADVPAAGGVTRQLTTFQSETPSYHPTRPLIAFTYGTWRRIVDDAKYPDIAQEIGTIDVSSALPATQPAGVVARSDSEDQAMAWSPNGQWIAFHTHREMSDDVWLKPADGSQPDKRITFLGRGAEVGWPRWSPDGRTVLLNGARQSDGASVLYVIGVDQETGALTSDLREVAAVGVQGEMGHAEWLPSGAAVMALVKEAPGRHAIFSIPLDGHAPATLVHRFATEHDFAGLGLSPNGRTVAFAAPAPDGNYQIFLKPVGRQAPAVQLTMDPSNKTQPVFSPDGTRVAFTVWSYEAAFWSFLER